MNYLHQCLQLVHLGQDGQDDLADQDHQHLLLYLFVPIKVKYHVFNNIQHIFQHTNSMLATIKGHMTQKLSLSYLKERLK